MLTITLNLEQEKAKMKENKKMLKKLSTIMQNKSASSKK